MTFLTSSHDLMPDEENFVQFSEPLWTIKDVARYLRLKPDTVRAMARRGDLPAIKVGNSWRFRPDLIKDWVSEKSIII
jgi:excisionase family DNA binding protein